MKKIQKNATKITRNILEGVTHVEYFVPSNNYEGGKVGGSLDEKTIGWVIDDLKGGHAILVDNEDGSYTLNYASPCKWEMK